MTPILPETDWKSSEDDWATKSAKRLKDALASSGKLQTRPSIQTWAQEFWRLSSTTPTDRIDWVLNWYIDHIQDPYVPRAFSAVSFRRKYAQIIQAMKRAGVSEKQDHEKHARITERLLGDIYPIGWPFNTPTMILHAISASVANYEDWRGRVSRVAEGSDRLARFAAHVLNRSGPTIIAMSAWWRAAHGEAHNRPSWSGDLSPYIWAVGSERVNAMGRQLSAEYSGSCLLWNELCEVIDAG